MNFIRLFSPATPEKNFTEVEIPLLQRDYAQGRIHADDARAARMRNEFLSALREALGASESPAKTLHLDFVYGEAQTGVFEPIDGQQRLTTLFLLHWYLASLGGRGGEFSNLMQSNGHGRLRFRYALRPATDRFFTALLELPNIASMPGSKNEPTFTAIADGRAKAALSDRLKDQAWFIDDWLHDPTVAGALVMLDAIAEKFGADSTDCANAYGKLSGDSSPITFDLLPLDSIGLGDDLYVKMNARGKPLNDFEKFKAWLIRHCETQNLTNQEDLIDQKELKALDNEWLEFFWRHSPRENTADKDYDRAEHVSRVFFRTVLALAVNHHAQCDSSDAKVEGWLNAPLHEQRDIWPVLFTPACIRYVIGQLNNWAKVLFDNETKAWRFTPPPRFGTEVRRPNNYPTAFLEHASEQSLELGMRLWLRALDVFAIHYQNSDGVGSPEAQEWLRGVRNLLEHTSANAKNYASITRGLGQLPGKLTDAPESILGLDRGQLKEEIRKAGLRNADAAWKKPIADAEDHELLRGQIEFLLGDETPSIDDFENRWGVFADWFPRIIKKDPDEIDLIRAILARTSPIHLGPQERLELPYTVPLWRARLERGERSSHRNFREGCFTLLSEAAQSGNRTIPQESTAAPDAEAWMRDFIRHGRLLWWLSDSGKIQNDRGNGVFLFHARNSHEHNILLGPVAALRNALIKKLTTAAPPWLFAQENEATWRPVNGVADQVFYKGRHISLHRSPSPDARFSVECVFGYHEITIRASMFAVGTGASEPLAAIVVPYPKPVESSDGAPCFVDLAQNLDDKYREYAARPDPDSGELESLRAALHELAGQARALAST